MRFLAVLLVAAAVVARWLVFALGWLYGDDQAQWANIVMVGLIVIAGAMWWHTVRRSEHGRHPSGRQENGKGEKGFVGFLTAVVGLVFTVYGVVQYFSPVTPRTASAPACSGVPVNGARYYAITEGNKGSGNNARSGPGTQYQELQHYPAGCTLGFDGYCVGEAEGDIYLGTPDQRWLLVHGTRQLVSASAVLTESAEANLGTSPGPQCASLGGLPQPRTISDLTYSPASGQVTARAPKAQLVGYAVVPASLESPYSTEAQSTTGPDFPAALPASAIAGDITGSSGQVVLGSAVCLAVDMPVADSLKTDVLTIRRSKIVSVKPDAHVDPRLRARLANFACDGS